MTKLILFTLILLNSYACFGMTLAADKATTDAALMARALLMQHTASQQPSEKEEGKQEEAPHAEVQSTDIGMQGEEEYKEAPQTITFDLSITHVGANTIVIYAHNGKEVGRFNTKLLAQSKILQHAFEDLAVNNDDSIRDVTHFLFQNVSTDEQAPLLIEALRHNNEAIPGLSETAQAFVNKVPKSQLIWLANEADRLDIKQVYNTLCDKLADPTQLPIKEYLNLNPDTGFDIVKRVNINKVWQEATKRITKKIVLPDRQNDWIESLSLSLDKNKLLITNQKTAYIYNIQTDQLIELSRFPRSTSDSFYIGSLHGQFTRDGNRVLLYNLYRVCMYNANTGELEHEFKTPPYYLNSTDYDIQSARFSEDKKDIIITANNHIFIEDANTYKRKMSFFTSDNAKIIGAALEVTRNGKKVLLVPILNNAALEIQIIDPTSSETIAPINIPGEFMGEFPKVAIVGNKARLFIIIGNAKIVVYDLHGWKLEKEFIIPDYSETANITMNDDINKVLIIYKNKKILLYDALTDQLNEVPMRYLEWSFRPHIMHANGDLSKLLLANQREIRIYDMHSQKLELSFLPPLEDHNDLIENVVFNEDESQLLVHSKLHRDIVIVPTINFNDLPFEQNMLLLKASASWIKSKAYMIQSDELEIYENLPQILKTTKLFALSEEEAALIAFENDEREAKAAKLATQNKIIQTQGELNALKEELFETSKDKSSPVMLLIESTHNIITKKFYDWMGW